MNDEVLGDCPECGGSVHRIMQTAGVIFRGPGFYITDGKEDKNGR